MILKVFAIIACILAYFAYQYVINVKIKCTTDFPLNGYQQCSYLWITFRGTFVNSKRQGFGELESDLIRFGGNWKNDLRDGNGKLEFLPTISENFGTIEGNWRNDVLDGVSTLKTYFGPYNITYDGFISQNKIHGKGRLEFFKSRGAALVGSLDCHFKNGKMAADYSNPCLLKTFEMEEKNTKLGIKEDHYNIMTFSDEWTSSGYSCNSSILHLNSSTSFYFNGFDTKPESKGEFRSIINYIKSFELYWLAKELILRRETIRINPPIN
jgi:hypothetical protein